MGQKIHPTGFRLSVQKNWSSKWYASRANFPVMLQEDIKVRGYLKKKLAHASVSRITIERPSKNARFTIYTSRPGIVIGKKGEDIEILRGELQKRMGVPVHVNIEEIRKPEIDAQLIADNIAQQLEKRIMFRRAMKRSIQNAMRLGAQGIKIMSGGRLNGIEIARSEWYREGRVPLHTLRADIDYGTSEAQTTYGAIGIKVWVFKGEIIGRNDQTLSTSSSSDQGEVDVEKKKKRHEVKQITKKPKSAATVKQVKKEKKVSTKVADEITSKQSKKPAIKKPTGKGRDSAADSKKPVAKKSKKDSVEGKKITKKTEEPIKSAKKPTAKKVKKTVVAKKPATKKAVKNSGDEDATAS
tara:strand:+ start:652 stop:1716 length:1065 start_codon:yes stop_codon:yes gene_type:complete